jgi:hypothetical protein
MLREFTRSEVAFRHDGGRHPVCPGESLGRCGIMEGSDDLKGVTGVGGHQFTTRRTVIVVRQIIVVVMF